MIEIVITVVLEVAKCLAPPLGRRIDYFRNYKANFEKLDQEVGNLKNARDDVKSKVDAALKNKDKIKPEVNKWQDEVESTIKETEELIGQKEADNRRCFKGLTKRHKHSKEALTKVGVIAGLLQQRFGEVSDPSIPDQIWLSSKHYETFESRNGTLKDVLNALNDADVHMVGVHGMGGIGKTTLAKEVGRRAKNAKLFDLVVFVEISENPDIKTIQQEIASKLGLSFNVETQSDRASKLFARLSNEKSILIILDNIWEELNLEGVGIPSGDDHGGRKLLFTSRDRQLLVKMGMFNKMKLFPIDKLGEDEAWKMFKKMADDDFENEELKALANNVVRQCGGLPIAIVTVAKALKGKRRKSQWREALRQLTRPSPTNFEGEYAKAYSSIKLSYDYLRDELQKTFLLCSLIRSYASEASISNLLKYVMGLDIFQATYTMEEARDKVCSLIDELKDFSLLLDGRNDEWFSLHDFVREVALSIANGDEHVFYFRNATNWELPCSDAQKKYKKIFLHDIEIGELPVGELECPQLESLCMIKKFDWPRFDPSLIKIPETFFMEMVKLKVLDLNRIQLFSLKSSLHSLVNLQTLCLDDSQFEDVAVIGEMRKLKILSLQYSNIKKLPSEIGQLAQLRLLDLSHCWQLKVIASNVISSLSRLEELYMTGCPVQWEVKGINVESGNACLDELCHSSQLTTLEIDIPDNKVLPTDFFSKELERYRISIGTGLDYMDGEPTTTRMLKLKLNSGICLKDSQNIKNAEVLYLDGWQGANDDVVFELIREGFSQLKHLHLKNNQLWCIVDSMNLVARRDACPSLESLYLSNLSNLEKICRGQLSMESFRKLKTIEVYSCDKLKNLTFPFSIQKDVIQRLQRINVASCKKMEEIFVIGGEDGIVNNNEVIEKIEFSQLRILILKDLPQLTSFYSSSEGVSNEIVLENRSDIPKSLFNAKVVFLKLEVLELMNIMNVEKIWDSQHSMISYENLTSLIVNNCQKLKSIFSSSVVKSLEQLQFLEISKCNVLKEIVAGGEEEEPKFVFPRVTYLKLWKLQELTTFCSGVHTSKWPMLKELQIGHCDKINVFTDEYNEESHFDISRLQSLFLAQKINPNLEKLTLGGKNITMMWQAQFPQNHFSKLKVSVKDDESTDSPLPIPKHLEKICLSKSSYKEIFSYEKYESYDRTSIQFLKMKNLFALKNMWKEDSKLDSLLQNIEILKVEYCHKLMNVVPSSASFQNLMTMEVTCCYGSLNIITSLTAKSLKQLREMKIASCRLLIEVVANEEDLVKDEIVFDKLKLLTLYNLECLTSFCSGNQTFIFPSLEELIVSRCPKMKNFSGGVISAPKLQKLMSSLVDIKGQWEGDLETTIQNLHKAKVNLNSEEYLTLIGNDVGMTWQGQFLEHCCSGLKILEVFKDESANIPLRILERFSNLEKLILKRSSYKELFSTKGGEKHGGIVTKIKTLELWGLFDLKQLWQQDSQLDLVLQNLETLEVNFCHSLINLVPNSASFENLTTLDVSHCDGLRNLVTSSTAKSLVRLVTLSIKNCEMMIDIVENKEDEARNDVIVVNNLKKLSLKYLESLSSFCCGNCSFNFPALKELTVKNCPKLKSFSKGVLITPELQEVILQEGNDKEGCWEGDLNTTIQQLHKKTMKGQSCPKDLGEASTQSPI